MALSKITARQLAARRRNGAVRRRAKERRREETLRLLNLGWTIPKIAAELGVEHRTIGLDIGYHAKQYGVFGAAQLLAEARRSGDLRVPRGVKPKPILSDRQKQVLTLIAKGWSTHRIVSHLRVTKAAVSGYISAINRRLGTRGRFDAIEKAVELGELPKSCRATTIENPLTDKECQVLKLWDDGLTHEEIGAEMGHVSGTSRATLRRICEKLLAPDLHKAMSLARRYHMIDNRVRRMPRVTRSIWMKIYAARKKPPHFTPRERDLLKALAKSRKTADLARRLRVAPGTVDQRCIALGRKLNAANRLSIALKAKELKLIHAVQIDRSERLEIGRRQLQILDALNRGESRRHIAQRLRMQFGTVHASVKNALLALKATSVKEALERYHHVRRTHRTAPRPRSAAIDHRMRRSF